MPPRSFWARVGGVCVVAWLIRLALFVPLHDSYYQSGLSVMFDDAAHNLLQGEGLVSHPDRWPVFQQEQARQWRLIDGHALRAIPHEPGPAYPFIAYMPAYPVMLSATYWLTGREWYLPIQLIQMFLDASTCGLLAWLGARVVSARVGLLAAGLYAVYLPAARLSFVPLPDALMPWLVTAGFASWVRLRRQPGWWWAMMCGALWGVATLVRPDVLFVPVVLGAIWWWLDGKKVGRYAIACLCACGFILSPWIIRNAVVLRAFVVTKPGVGINLIELLGKYDSTNRLPGTDQELAAREGFENLYYPDGLARDRQRLVEATAIIRQQPWWYATLVARQIPRLFFENFFGILPGPEWPEMQRAGYSLTRYAREYPTAAILRVLRRLSGILEWLVVIGAAVGAWILMRARRRRELALVGLIPLYYVVVHIPMFTVARYFLPAVPCVLLLSIVGWMAVLKIRWAA